MENISLPQLDDLIALQTVSDDGLCSFDSIKINEYLNLLTGEERRIC